ncbi:hypothetical protein OG698_45580 [Streptomyces sp. NBC_01003]|nr:hypothetical protein OG698_45580 [Streptomyces sp. NBC_01003]
MTSNNASEDASSVPGGGTFLLSAVVIALFWRAHHAALRNAGPIDSYLF